MANGSTQLNTRIDARVKREGDAVFARFGLTPSLVVRAVWGYAIDHQRPPEFMLPNQDEDGKNARIAALREGAGLALRRGGPPCSPSSLSREEPHDEQDGVCAEGLIDDA